MKPWENVVSDMKLRASYGVNGNLRPVIMVIMELILPEHFIMENLLRGKMLLLILI